MMKKLFFALLVLATASASAQNGVTNEFRFGPTPEDSMRCINTITIANVNLNNKDYATADEIRANLDAEGIILNDTKDGTTWDFKALYK